MFKFIAKLFGNKYDRDVKELAPIVVLINEEFAKLKSVSNDELRNKTLEFKKRIQEHLQGIDEDIAQLKKDAEETTDFYKKEDLWEEVDDLILERDKHLEEILEVILPEAFAVVKETARRFTENTELITTATDRDRDLSLIRSNVTIEGDKAHWANKWDAAGAEITWAMVHYDVQLIGGIVLHRGKIAEMMTGEGKTLVATLPAYLNALSGQGVHIITVNNYLARRDCEWMTPIYEFLHLSADCIDKYKPHTPKRVAAYKADITFGTNSEFGFDYLRDNMVRSTDELVQGKHHFAMIDEVDSVLIDDARTPLIISGPIPKGDQQEYEGLKPRIEKLMEVQRKLATGYLSEAKAKFAQGNTGNEEGEGGLALLRAHRALPKYRPLIKFMNQPGVKVLFQKTENFYMQEQSKNMHLADAPLYFVIEEKTNSVELTEKGSEFLAKFENDPEFFVMPNITEQMMEVDMIEDKTEEERLQIKDELMENFALKSKRLHSISQLLKAYAMFQKDDAYIVVDGQVKIVDEQTGRVMDGRRYSDGLHQALEAKENVKIEAATQTYATVTLQNFFRMYHKLAGMTGTAETEAKELWDIYKLDVVVIPTNRPIARRDEEDVVYKTALEKYNAIVDEIERLTKRGQPVLVGTTSVDISELLSRFLTRKGITHNVLNAKKHQREAEIVAGAGQSGAVTIATNMAGRGTDIKLGAGVKEAGGLAIIGTERHESRRVDRQLRGRSGRQGDPGSSQFFVCLEDKLMRLFGSERIAKLMDKMGHQPGDVIQHSMVTKSIERAQRKVEENNFGIRKRLLEYDDVMNIQREAIYKKRHHALFGERLSLDVHNMFVDLAEELMVTYKDREDFEGFKLDAYHNFGIEIDFDEVEFKEGNTAEMVQDFQKKVMERYHKKMADLTEKVMPVIHQVYKNEGDVYKRIAIPFGDGKKMMQLSADLKEAVDSEGKSIVNAIEKSISLALIDDSWKEHLRTMDETKESVQAASFEQKDPLVVYKIEAFDLFSVLVSNINRKVTSFLSKGRVLVHSQEDVQQARVQKTDMSKLQSNRSPEAEAAAAAKAARAAGQPARQKPVTYKRVEKKVGRNEPCPCGSGKKYKQCHGRG